jgi:flagellar basal-body rod protein FlgB
MLQALDAFLSPQLAALDLRARRTEVLSSNIANADTPNFKARDFDFASALRAVQSGQSRMEVTRTSPGHLPGHGSPGPLMALQYRIPAQPSIDGNTVELDSELAQFSDNALRYQADLTFLGQRLNTLRTAISGQ